MTNGLLITVISLLMGISQAILIAQPAPPSQVIRASHVPFGSKKNTIQLVVMNKGVKKAQDLVVTAYDVPWWFRYTTEADTLHYKLKDEQATAAFEFSLEPTAPVGVVSSLFFTVSSASGEKWTKELKVIVDAPKRFELLQNYPNPFNPLTVIGYELPYGTNVSLKIYDLLGREVLTLVDGLQEVGHQEATFDASAYSSGVYFYRLQAGNYSSVKKLMLLK